MFFRASFTLFLAGGLLLLLPPAASAASPGVALVVGNGTYGALPSLPACLRSAHAVASALTAQGFQVVQREDASTGGMDAAFSDFSRELAASGDAPAFVYSCGYATAFNNRPFMLPVSARIARPTDVLTQGVLAKLLVDVIARGSPRTSIVAIDVVPVPDAPPALGLDALLQTSLPQGMGLVAVSQAKPADAPTLLAVSLVAGLKGAQVQTAPLLANLQQQLANQPVTLAALHAPLTSGYLAGAPPPAPPPPPQVQAVVAPAAPAPAPPPPTPAVVVIPSDDQMTDNDRRTVQTALARLGYYPGPIDGVFGPDTRAAIRRYQHELGADMTGRLTGTQASRLASGQ